MQSESNVLMISHAIQGTEHAQLFDKTIHECYPSQKWVTEAFFTSTVETFIWE
jgi:hypothetical protein